MFAPPFPLPITSALELESNSPVQSDPLTSKSPGFVSIDCLQATLSSQETKREKKEKTKTAKNDKRQFTSAVTACRKHLLKL